VSKYSAFFRQDCPNLFVQKHYLFAKRELVNKPNIFDGVFVLFTLQFT